MDPQRLTEWLSTAEGLGKAIIAFVGMPIAIWAAVANQLFPITKYIGIPSWTVWPSKG
jgi:hypothetical protein